MLQGAESEFVLHESEENRLEPGGARVVLLVGVGRRCDDGVDRLGAELRDGATGVGVVNVADDLRAIRNGLEVVGDLTNAVEPGANDGGVFLWLSDAHFWAKMKVSDGEGKFAGEG